MDRKQNDGKFSIIKVFHIYIELVDNFLEQLDDEFGREILMNKLNQNWKRHCTTGLVRIEITDCLRMVLRRAFFQLG
jgi:hypothetical protein